MPRVGMLSLVAGVALAACCPDPTGNRSKFKAGPVTTASYQISAVRDCPAIDQGLIASGRGFSGSIAITRTGAQGVTADWLRVSLEPSLRTAGLAFVATGVGAPCDPAAPPAVYVIVDNWYQVDAVVRQINLQLAIDQLGGEVDVVIQPINALCQAGRGKVAAVSDERNEVREAWSRVQRADLPSRVERGAKIRS